MNPISSTVIDSRWQTRLVLVLGIVAGVAHAIETILAAPEQIAIASDVYFYAAQAALDGGDVYGVTPPDHVGYHYLYPPIVLLAFVPHALLGSTSVAFVLQTLLNAGAIGGITVIIWRALTRRDITFDWIDRGLILGFVAFSIFAIVQVIQGQTTLWLAFGLALGFDALERGRERLAGVAFAGAALIKLFPAVIGLWLIRERADRALGTAIVTGLGGLLAGVFVFGPDLTTFYLSEVLVGRYQGTTFDGETSPQQTLVTARRQLVAIFGIGPPVLTILTAVVIAPFVLACYRRIDTDKRRLAAILATLVGTLLYFPFQPLYFSLLFYPLVILLYTLSHDRSRRLLIGGTVVGYLFIGYDIVARTLHQAPIGTALESLLLELSAHLFAFILPPTVGLWLILFACVSIQFRDE